MTLSGCNEPVMLPLDAMLHRITHHNMMNILQIYETTTSLWLKFRGRHNKQTTKKQVRLIFADKYAILLLSYSIKVVVAYLHLVPADHHANLSGNAQVVTFILYCILLLPCINKKMRNSWSRRILWANWTVLLPVKQMTLPKWVTLRTRLLS